MKRLKEIRERQADGQETTNNTINTLKWCFRHISVTKEIQTCILVLNLFQIKKP
jgi:hypothetical protein